MRRNTIYGIITGISAVFLCAACSKGPKQAWIEIPPSITESRIDVPGVRIIDVHTTGFTANWHKVVDAFEYEYVFDDGDTLFTTDTNVIFTDLQVDSEHRLWMRALPRKESDRKPSAFIEVDVMTREISPLDTPILTAGSTFTSTSVLSWDVVPNACEYEWALSYYNDEQQEDVAVDGGNTNLAYITLKGLIEKRQYTFSVIAIPSDTVQYKNSASAAVEFTPTSDGSTELLFSSFRAVCDGISFNVFANAGQYYWYEIIPAPAFLKYPDEDTYFSKRVDSLRNVANDMIKGGMLPADAWSAILESGSQCVEKPACSLLTYSIGIFGMNLSGDVTTGFTRKELKTPSEFDNSGPSYKGAGDWYRQNLYLGADPTATIGVERYGTGVTRLQYLLYTTSKFIEKFGSEMSGTALSQIIEQLESDGNEASDQVINNINSPSGSRGSYSNRSAATSYTLAGYATNSAGQKMLCINSISTRSNTEDNHWIKYGFSAIGTTSFTIKLSLADGCDAVSGKFFVGDYDEVTSKYSASEYPALILEKGRDLTAEECALLTKEGIVAITQEGLESGKSYIVGFAATDSCGDTGFNNTKRLTLK